MKSAESPAEPDGMRVNDPVPYRSCSLCAESGDAELANEKPVKKPAGLPCYLPEKRVSFLKRLSRVHIYKMCVPEMGDIRR